MRKKWNRGKRNKRKGIWQFDRLTEVEVTHDDAAAQAKPRSNQSSSRRDSWGFAFSVIQWECSPYFRYIDTQTGWMEACTHAHMNCCETLETKIRFCPTACRPAWSLSSVTIGFSAFSLASFYWTDQTMMAKQNKKIHVGIKTRITQPPPLSRDM
jgi:hypothetical protein